MAICTDPKTFSEYLIAYGPLIVSAAIACFAWLQWKLAKKNFKLSLYQRRFAIYHAVNQYYLSFGKNALNASWTSPKFNEEATKLSISVNESGFLFKPEDNIQEFLTEFVAKTTPHLAEHTYDMEDLRLRMVSLRVKMKPYLDFSNS